jgi:putative ABC transport system substrate-binding protein
VKHKVRAGTVPQSVGRRDVLALIGGAAAIWPRAAIGQQSEKMRRIGVLVGIGSSVNDPLVMALLRPFQAAMQQAGWIDGRNIHIDYRFAAGGTLANIDAAATELVALAPELIFAVGLPAARALRRKTHSIPIVFTRVADPVGFGLVASVRHPGGNVTGFMTETQLIGGKWLQLLLECAPQLNHVGIIYNPDTGPYGAAIVAAAKAAARPGVTVIEYRVHDDHELEAALSSVADQPRGGAIIVPEPFNAAHGGPIITQATRLSLPILFPTEGMAERGALISYTYSTDDIMRLPVTYIDRILKGESPADLPVQEPTKYELVINAKTAKALGLTIPSDLIATADRVIE